MKREYAELSFATDGNDFNYGGFRFAVRKAENEKAIHFTYLLVAERIVGFEQISNDFLSSPPPHRIPFVANLACTSPKKFDSNTAFRTKFSVILHNFINISTAFTLFNICFRKVRGK